MIDSLASMQIHGNGGDIAHMFLLIAVISAVSLATR